MTKSSLSIEAKLEVWHTKQVTKNLQELLTEKIRLEAMITKLDKCSSATNIKLSQIEKAKLPILNEFIAPKQIEEDARSQKLEEERQILYAQEQKAAMDKKLELETQKKAEDLLKFNMAEKAVASVELYLEKIIGWAKKGQSQIILPHAAATAGASDAPVQIEKMVRSL